MRKFYLCIKCIALVALYGQTHAADRYWVGASTYLNNFQIVTDLNQWVLADDNGTGSWLLSGHGTGILRMDDGPGGFSNRLLNVSGGLANYLPLDRVNGTVSFQVVRTTGGTQEFSLRVEEYDAGGTLLTQQTLVGPTSALGSFVVTLNSVPWSTTTTQIRFVLVAENLSGQQGTVELNYFHYTSSSNRWGAAANWSDSPGGVGGAGVPGAADHVIFDGSSGFNAPCLLSGSVTVAGISMVGYTGTIDLRGSSLTSIGSNTFNTGAIANPSGSGVLNFNSTGTTTFAGTSFYVTVSGSCRVFFFNGSYFNNTVALTKTGASDDTGAGGNTFQSTVTFTNNSSGSWRFANASPDIFHGPLTLNVGVNPAASIELAYAATGNQFNDNITINYNTTGAVNFGSAGGTSALAAGKILTVSTCSGGDCGSLSLGGIDIAAPQTINFPGTGTGTLRTAPASAWHGDLSVTAGAILLDGATFHGVTTITKTGTSVDESRGGNVFKSSTTITNAGAGTLRMAAVDGDTFEAPVVFERTGSGLVEPAYNGNSSFTADVTTNSALSITFGGGNGMVTFTGADAQTLSRATGTAGPTIQRLVMNKSANILTLNTPVSIGVSADFLAGIIQATTSNYVSFVNGATVSNAKDASHVDGVVKKTGNTDFVFPVGDDGIYRPITITAVSNASIFTAQFFRTPQLLGSAKAGTLQTLSSCEYWRLDRESGGGTPYVTLSWRSNDCSASLYVSAPADLRVARWDGASWDDYGASGYTGINAAGTVTTVLPVVDFGPFVLASATPNNPLSVLKAITVTVNGGQSKIYGDAEPVLTYSLSAPLDGSDVFTGQLARATGEEAGSYAITQGTLAAGSNYQLSFVGDDFTITPKAITVTVNADQSKTYGAAEPMLTYSLSTALVGSDALTGQLARGTGENVGIYPVTQGTLDAGGNYQLSFVGDDFTISPKAVTIIVDAGQSKTYGDTDPTLTYSLSTPLVGSDVFTGGLTRTSGEGAGTYAITQGTLAAGGNYHLSFVGDDFTISPKAVTIIVDAGQSKTYGNTDPTLTYSLSAPLVGSDVFTGGLTRTSGEGAGTYAITQGTLAAGGNYHLSFVGDDFTVIPKTITVTVNAGQSKVYGVAEPMLTYSLSAALVGSDVLTGQLARATGEDVGIYPVTQGTLDAGSNYQLSFVGDDFTILPKAVTIDANARTKVYGEADPVLTYTLTPPLLPGDNMSGALTRDPGETAGTYTIRKGTLDAGSNYAMTFQEAALVITRQQQSIIFNDLPEKAEGDQPFTITATASSGLPVTFTSSDENIAIIVNNTVAISGVGTVIITAHQDGNEGFEPATPVSHDLVVRESGLFVPNLFSPDGNGANDTFIVHAAGVREIQLVIYNRLGQEVFRTTDIDTATRTGWNGRKGNEEQPAGTYAWSLQGYWSNGDPISFQGKNHGQVVLLR